MTAFGTRLKELRKAKGKSLRKVALAIGKSHAYLSQIESGKCSASDEVIVLLAGPLEEDPDVLLAMAGRVSARFQKALMERPRLFGELLNRLETAPKGALLRVVREVRDGNW